MKDCPKLPMLSFEFKYPHSSSPDLVTPIKRFIREFYGDDGELYNKEIKELENLRMVSVPNPGSCHDISKCSMLKRYYAQLYTFYNKVKITKGHLDAKFTWCDAYNNGHSITGDMQYELDCILYNIGAMHAEMGASSLRNNEASLKEACTHFQCAVWAFEQLKNHPQNFKSKDMSHDIVSFIYHTLLAQAQECSLEKSVDFDNPFLVARVAAQVVEYYNNALIILIQASLNADANIITDIVGPKLFKDWKKFIEFKISFYSAVCALYMGDHCGQSKKFGERIAWYNSGIDNLKQAEKLCKSIGRSENLTSAYNYLTDLLSKKSENAEKENNLIYHEVIPTADKLTAVKGAALAKGIEFDVSDPAVCGKDIFARLVPIEAHEMASLYSVEKDRIKREILDEVDEKNTELASYLSSLQLDKEKLRPQRGSNIPDELIEMCAELSVKPNICNDVRESLRQLLDLGDEVTKIIDEGSTLIKTEEEKEKKHQERFGKRAPSLRLVELEKELRNNYRKTHSKGLACNENLRQSLEKVIKDVELLKDCSAKDLENLMPPYSDIPIDENNIREIERLIDKLQEMKNQRTFLVQQLTNEIQNDDALRHVLAHSKDDLKEIFERELKKYDSKVGLIRQNLIAQENILNALTKASASYGKARMAINEVNRLRENRIKTLKDSFEDFMRIKSEIDKVTCVYKDLRATLDKWLARVKSVIKVQDEERLQFLQMQIKKETGHLHKLSLGGVELPSAGTAKLKDYLPYMNYRNNPVNPVPSSTASPRYYQYQHPQINSAPQQSYVPPTSAHMMNPNTNYSFYQNGHNAYNYPNVPNVPNVPNYQAYPTRPPVVQDYTSFDNVYSPTMMQQPIHPSSQQMHPSQAQPTLHQPQNSPALQAYHQPPQQNASLHYQGYTAPIQQMPQTPSIQEHYQQITNEALHSSPQTSLAPIITPNIADHSATSQVSLESTPNTQLQVTEHRPESPKSELLREFDPLFT